MRDEQLSGLGAGPTTKSGQILANGLIQLDYYGVPQCIGDQNQTVQGRMDGIISIEKSNKSKPRTAHDAAAASAVPVGLGVFSEMSMMQAFQRFQAGTLQVPSVPVAAQVPPAMSGSVNSFQIQQTLVADARAQHDTLLHEVDSITANTAAKAEEQSATSPKENTAPLHIQQPSIPPAHHDPASVNQYHEAKVSNIAPGLEDVQAHQSHQILLPTQAQAYHELQAQLAAQPISAVGLPPGLGHQAHQTQIASQVDQAYSQLQAQAAAEGLFCQAPQVQVTPAVKEAPAAGLTGLSHEALLPMREQLLMARRDAELLQARMENLKQIELLQHQIYLRGVGAFDQQGIQTIQQDSLLRQHPMLGGAHACLQNHNRTAMGYDLDHPIAMSAQQNVAEAFSFDQQQRRRDELAAITTQELLESQQDANPTGQRTASPRRTRFDDNLPQFSEHHTTLEELKRLASLSSMRSDLIPDVGGRWTTSLSHDQLLGLLRCEQLLGLRGLSTLSQQELLQLRAASLAASINEEEKEDAEVAIAAFGARNDLTNHMAELWNQQQLHIAGVADDLGNEANENVDTSLAFPEQVEKRQSSLDILAQEAAERADRRSFVLSSPASSLSDENIPSKRSEKQDIKAKKSIWENMKKTIGMKGLKPGKSTENLMDNMDASSNQCVIDASGIYKSSFPFTKKRKLNTTPEIQVDTKETDAALLLSFNLAPSRSQSSVTPSILSSKLARFKAQQNNGDAVAPNQPENIPAPNHPKLDPPEAADCIKLANNDDDVPLSEVSFRKQKNNTTEGPEEGQFDDPEEEE
jgi:hypothetical protein